MGNLLGRYKALRPPQGVVLEVFMRAVEEVCGVVLLKSMLTYKVASRTVAVAGGGPLKSELALKRHEILRLCEKELGEKSAPLHIL